MKHHLWAIPAVGALAITASASLFKVEPAGGWTLGGLGTSIQGAPPPDGRVRLTIRDDLGALPPLAFEDLQFEADMQMGSVHKYLIGKGPYYGLIIQAPGTIELKQGEDVLLRITTTQCQVLVDRYLPGQGWYTPSLHSGLQALPSTQTRFEWFGPNLPTYGVVHGSSVGLADFNCVFANVNGGVTTLPASPYPTVSWTALGMLNGRAMFVPSPAGLLVLGVGFACTGCFRKRLRV